MYNLNTAEMLERIYRSNESDCYESFKDIELAMNISDYYINPRSNNGKDNFELFSKYYRELYPGIEQPPILYDNCLRAKLYLRVIKEQFDYDYFKERFDFHKHHNDPECLLEWLNKLSSSQLKELLKTIVEETIFVFSSKRNSVDNLYFKLNQACMDAGAPNPDIKLLYVNKKNIGGRISRIENYFSYISEEVIIKIFCESLQGDNKLRAATLAYEMYTGGIDAVKERICLWYCD